jgi:hypothetical protein
MKGESHAAGDAPSLVDDIGPSTEKKNKLKKIVVWKYEPGAV